MRASLRAGLGLLACAVVAVVPLACQQSGVGDPCTPEDEYLAGFSGYAMGQEYIESRSFQCATRICLVNHFQGRVSCPLGQSSASVKDCGGPGGARDELCDAGKGEKCVLSDTIPVPCTRLVCGCGDAPTPPAGYHCSEEGGVAVMKSFVCHVPGSCQSAGASAADNAGKACCEPGTDTPIRAAVCGQCDAASNRAAAEAVYCSCRCGVADGDPEEPNVNFCTCPSGFTCSQIRPDLHLGGDPELNGKYCIKDGTAYSGSLASCGLVSGNVENFCQGLAAP